MVRRQIAWVWFALLQMACQHGPQRTANQRGIYLGGQINSFTACGESKVLSVEGSDA